MTKIKIIIIIIVIFLNCEKYPPGCIVDLKLEHPHNDTATFNKLHENLLITLSAFAKEKKDFTVFNQKKHFEKDSSQEVTHLINVKVENIILIEYQDYKTALDSVNPKLERSLKGAKVLSWILPPVPGGHIGKIAAQEGLHFGLSEVTKYKAYSAAPHPQLVYSLNVRNVKSGEQLLSTSDTIRVYSNVAILKKDQLSQLLSVFYGAIREELPFFDD